MFIYIEGMKAISEQKWSQEMHVKTRKCTYWKMSPCDHITQPQGETRWKPPLEVARAKAEVSLFSVVCWAFLTLYNTDIGTEVNRRCVNVNCCIKLTVRKYAHNCTRSGLIWEQWRGEMRHLPNVRWQCRGHAAGWGEAISDYEAYHLSAWLSERKTETPGNIYSPVRIPVLLAFHHQKLFFQFLKTKLQKLWAWT